jgi:hypothetical protein
MPPAIKGKAMATSVPTLVLVPADAVSLPRNISASAARTNRITVYALT